MAPWGIVEYVVRRREEMDGNGSGVHMAIKQLTRRAIGAFGYAIREVGCGVGGVALLHDARILMGMSQSPSCSTLVPTSVKQRKK